MLNVVILCSSLGKGTQSELIIKNTVWTISLLAICACLR